MPKLRLLMLCIALLCSGSCAEVLFESVTPELRQAVIGVTNRYLTAVTKGDEKVITSMIYWPDYLDNGGPNKELFDKQLEELLKRFPIENQTLNHPLLGLKVMEVSSKGNFAEIRLIKNSGNSNTKVDEAKADEVKLKLIWSGTGWLVTSDSIFGRGKLIDNLALEFPS